MWQKTKNFYHLFNAGLANFWCLFPSKKITVIGVTGTDGKTTTTSLIYHILNKSGKNASMISSIGAIIGGKNYDIGFHVTTPSSFSLQKFIRRISKNIRDKEGNYLVLETTSHALDQHRVFGIKYEVGVLTNVTHEHLDYHKTYENYVKTKLKLLKMARIAVVNRDDNSYKLISNFKFLISRLVTYGVGKNADINPENFPFETSLIGEFNKYNILAAISACKALGIKDEDIRSGIESFVVPLGREDVVYNNSFAVMIDFAHTPNAFEQILKSVRPQVKGRLIHVFGSAGLRDRTKRPIMGKISSQYADIIVLTSEDPRTESVERIISEITSGIQNSKFPTPSRSAGLRGASKIQIYKIPDRKKAIETAIKMAKRGDFVVITGKSHEKSMNYGHGEVAWDEYGVVRCAISDKRQAI